MKAVTLWQPWASLVALGVKTIETRSWPAPKSLIGERIAIHASATINAEAKQALRPRPGVGPQPPIVAALSAGGCRLRWDGGARRLLDHDLPLGAVVATAVLTDCVPMVAHNAGQVEGDFLVVGLSGELTLVKRALAPDRIWRVVTDQLPYGDFAPGRWAWLLDDVQPTTERCPACWGTGSRCEWRSVTGLPCAHCGDGGQCHACAGGGSCAPIPAKGRQGVWEWTP